MSKQKIWILLGATLFCSAFSSACKSTAKSSPVAEKISEPPAASSPETIPAQFEIKAECTATSGNPDLIPQKLELLITVTSDGTVAFNNSAYLVFDKMKFAYGVNLGKVPAIVFSNYFVPGQPRGHNRIALEIGDFKANNPPVDLSTVYHPGVTVVASELGSVNALIENSKIGMPFDIEISSEPISTI